MSKQLIIAGFNLLIIVEYMLMSSKMAIKQLLFFVGAFVN